ncbi:RB1-inducible coiled-coil 1 isoform X1 [Sigmodon hispidus]
MKLYVFLVNTGTTLTFDTELTVQTVTDLKHDIQNKYKIAIQHQVLVVNGGECMAADRRVCTYSAGTDTNPIFLFNKEMILCDHAPAIPKTTFSTENDMEIKVEESLMMPAVFHTVASRTQLAVVLSMMNIFNTKVGLQSWPIWRTVQIHTKSFFSSLKVFIQIICNP